MVVSPFAFVTPRLTPRLRACALIMGWLCLVLVAMWSMSAPAADFLDPAQAFQFSAKVVDQQHVDVHYKIAPGYYLYKERFRFAAEPATVKVGTPEFPPAEVKFDETFNKNVEHYRNDVTVRLPIEGSGAFTLISTAQGCADAGLCYPPQEARASLDLRSVAATPPAAAQAGSVAPMELSRTAQTLASGNLFKVAALFVGFGLLLSFTPCVWPMFPILSSIIAGETGTGPAVLTRARGFLLALAYSLGIAVVYTGLGIGAGLAGQGLAQTLQRPEVLITFALALAALSLSMFGVYQLQMPNAVQSRANDICGKVGGGRLFSVFLMGAVSALVVGPCVAAPLAATLLYISQTRDVVIGGVALFSIAIGICLPLLVLGAWEGAMLPRAGAWMETVKRTFGVLLLGVAIWMASPALPAGLTLLLWAGLLMVTSVYMHAFDSLPAGTVGWKRLWKGVGLLMFVIGVAQIIGAATGGSDPLRPLAGFSARADRPAAAALAFVPVRSTEELNQQLAHGAGKPVMLDFTAEWCVACKEMERDTYADPRVVARLADFTLLKADVTDNSPEAQALLKRYSLYGPPGILFFDKSGQPVPAATVIGYQNADAFLDTLSHAVS